MGRGVSNLRKIINLNSMEGVINISFHILINILGEKCHKTISGLIKVFNIWHLIADISLII